MPLSYNASVVTTFERWRFGTCVSENLPATNQLCRFSNSSTHPRNYWTVEMWMGKIALKSLIKSPLILLLVMVSSTQNVIHSDRSPRSIALFVSDFGSVPIDQYLAGGPKIDPGERPENSGLDCRNCQYRKRNGNLFPFEYEDQAKLKHWGRYGKALADCLRIPLEISPVTSIRRKRKKY